jgi:hypothetical protein
MLGVPPQKLMGLVRMGARIASLVGFGRGGRKGADAVAAEGGSKDPPAG